MRYILLVLFVFVTTFASAQVQFLGSPTTTVRNRGNFVSDSLFYLPKRQVAPSDTAAMRYAISDSSVYVWTGRAWRSIGRAGASFLSVSDTSSMLSPYIRAAGNGLTKSGQSLLVDTLTISTRAWRRKGLDSLAALELSLSDTASMLTPYTRGSGTTNYLPKFTGTRTFGNSQIFDNGTRIGINTTAPVAPFQIGNANYYPSDDPVLLLSRNVNNDGGMSGTNAHSISEASIITRSGNIAFAGIENRAKFSGTNSFDHYAGFQNGLKYSSTGTITNYFGYYDALSVDSGTVTNAYGIYLQDATKAASATLTNNYGIYIADRTAGTNDWTIYSNSTANSYFKGQINASKIITNEGNTAANATAEIEIQTNSGSKADLRLYQLGNNYWDIQIPANQTYLSIGDIAGTYLYLKNGGEVNIGSVTDAGAYALQVAGAIYNTTGAVFAATSGTVAIKTTSTDGGVQLQLASGGERANLARFYSNVDVGGATAGGSAASPALFFNGDSNTGLYWLSGDFIGVTTNGVNRMTWDNAGNVGIGTTTPSQPLHVVGNILTAAPSGGTAKPFKIGEAATVSPTSPNRTIRVEIDGTVYYIHAKTTND